MFILGKRQGLRPMNYKTKMLTKEVKIMPTESSKKETGRISIKQKTNNRNNAMRSIAGSFKRLMQLMKLYVD